MPRNSKATALKNDLRESADERLAVLERTAENQAKLLRLQQGAPDRRTGHDRRYHHRRHLKLR